MSKRKRLAGTTLPMPHGMVGDHDVHMALIDQAREWLQRWCRSEMVEWESWPTWTTTWTNNARYAGFLSTDAGMLTLELRIQEEWGGIPSARVAVLLNDERRDSILG